MVKKIQLFNIELKVLDMFDEMINDIKVDVVKILLNIKKKKKEKKEKKQLKLQMQV